MSGTGSKRSHGGTARPIRTRRDFKAAASVVDSIAPQAEKETAAEKRLQALIHEMEKFDDSDDGDESSGGSGEGYDGPRRRWSDDSGDADS
jgi:hypothetical protein